MTSATQDTTRPFHPGPMQRRLAMDTATKWTLWGLLLLSLLASLMSGPLGIPGLGMAPLPAIVAWVAMTFASARVTRELPRITALVLTNSEDAELAIQRALGPLPMMRWVRLQVYHRLAVLRHRQGRFDDTAAICENLMAYPLGPGKGVATHVLLMLAESRLTLGQTPAAYPALLRLHQRELGLAESLQYAALQTRYEFMMGRADQAASDWASKAQWAELLPMPAAGIATQTLAQACAQAGLNEPARWLKTRAELMLAQEPDRDTSVDTPGVVSGPAVALDPSLSNWAS